MVMRMGTRWQRSCFIPGLSSTSRDEPAPPAQLPAGHDALERSVAAHPAKGATGSGPEREAHLVLVPDHAPATPASELNARLDSCPLCAPMGAELCDRCAEAVLAACGQERRERR